MKKTLSLAAAAILCISAFAQENAPSISVHGFVRNYYAVDTHEMVGLTEDFFTYVPKDGKEFEYTNARFAALTSRLWVEVKGYEVEGVKVGARIEGDFYNGLGDDKVTGTANLRLRQAFVTLAKNDWAVKAGQAWHPLAADMPDVFSLNTGAPFGPFSRTPLFQFDYKLSEGLSLTAAAVWQMQYTSTGPDGKSAKYMKWGCTPEIYAGLNYVSDGLTLRAGVDVLSIKPRNYDAGGFVSDRLTTVTPFLYAQWKRDAFSVKFKTVYAQAGEHLNLNGGYGVSAVNDDGSWEYTPTVNSSSWLSLKYAPGKVDWILFAGYVKNFGTTKPLFDSDFLWFSGNSFANMNSMYRLTPTVVYNLGKVAIGLEYEHTSVHYGDVVDGMNVQKGLYDRGLHWVTNHRVQGMLRYTF